MKKWKILTENRNPLKFSWIFPKKYGGIFLQDTPILYNRKRMWPRRVKKKLKQGEYCSYVVEVPVEDILWTNIHKTPLIKLCRQNTNVLEPLEKLEGILDQSSKLQWSISERKRTLQCKIEKILLKKRKDLIWSWIPISGKFKKVEKVINKNDRVLSDTLTSPKGHP